MSCIAMADAERAVAIVVMRFVFFGIPAFVIQLFRAHNPRSSAT